MKEDDKIGGIQDLIKISLGVGATLGLSGGHNQGWRCWAVVICVMLPGPFSSSSVVLYIVLLLCPSPLHAVIGKRVRQYHS